MENVFEQLDAQDKPAAEPQGVTQPGAGPQDNVFAALDSQQGATELYREGQNVPVSIGDLVKGEEQAAGGKDIYQRATEAIAQIPAAAGKAWQGFKDWITKPSTIPPAVQSQIDDLVAGGLPYEKALDVAVRRYVPLEAATSLAAGTAQLFPAAVNVAEAGAEMNPLMAPSHLAEKLLPQSVRPTAKLEATQRATADVVQHYANEAGQGLANATGVDLNSAISMVEQNIPFFLAGGPEAAESNLPKAIASAAQKSGQLAQKSLAAFKLGAASVAPSAVGAVKAATFDAMLHAIGLGGPGVGFDEVVSAFAGFSGRSGLGNPKVANAVAKMFSGKTLDEIIEKQQAILKTRGGQAYTQACYNLLRQKAATVQEGAQGILEKLEPKERDMVTKLASDGSYLYDTELLSKNGKIARDKLDQAKDLVDKSEAIFKTSKVVKFAKTAATAAANMGMHTAVGAGIGAGFMGAQAPTGKSGEAAGAGALIGAIFGGLASPFASAKGVHDLRVEQNRAKMIELGTGYLRGHEGLPQELVDDLLVTAGALRGLGGKIVVGTPEELVKAGGLPKDSSPGLGFVGDDRTVYLNRNNPSIAAPHELQHVLREAFGKIARLDNPEAIARFEKMYGEALDKTGGAGIKFDTESERDAEIGRKFLEHTPLEYWFGGETGGDIIKRAINGLLGFKGIRTVSGFEAPYIRSDWAAIQKRLGKAGEVAQLEHAKMQAGIPSEHQPVEPAVPFENWSDAQLNDLHLRTENYVNQGLSDIEALQRAKEDMSPVRGRTVGEKQLMPIPAEKLKEGDVVEEPSLIGDRLIRKTVANVHSPYKDVHEVTFTDGSMVRYQGNRTLNRVVTAGGRQSHQTPSYMPDFANKARSIVDQSGKDHFYADEIKYILKQGGVSKEQQDLLGISDIDGKVTKQDVIDTIAENSVPRFMPQIQEGAIKASAIKTPEGKIYEGRIPYEAATAALRDIGIKADTPQEVAQNLSKLGAFKQGFTTWGDNPEFLEPQAASERAKSLQQLTAREAANQFTGRQYMADLYAQRHPDLKVLPELNDLAAEATLLADMLHPYSSNPHSKEYARFFNALLDVRDRQHKLIEQSGIPREMVAVGGGPAGMAIALDTANEGWDTVVIEKRPQTGGASGKSFHISNVEGQESGVRGLEYHRETFNLARIKGAQFKLGQEFQGYEYDPKTRLYTVKYGQGKTMKTPTLWLTLGRETKIDPRYPPSTKFKNLTYWDVAQMERQAKDGTAVIIGGSNSAAQAVRGMRRARKVILLARSPLTKMSASERIAMNTLPWIEPRIGPEHELDFLVIEDGVVKAAVTKGANGIPGEIIKGDTFGIFYGGPPNTGMLPKEILTTKAEGEAGLIRIDPVSHSVLNSKGEPLPGLYAAGDASGMPTGEIAPDGRRLVGSAGRIGAAAGDARNGLKFSNRYTSEFFGQKYMPELPDVLTPVEGEPKGRYYPVNPEDLTGHSTNIMLEKAVLMNFDGIKTKDSLGNDKFYKLDRDAVLGNSTVNHMPELNIGLKKGNEDIAPEAAIDALHGTGVGIVKYSVLPSETGPTLVATLNRPLTAKEGDAVAKALGQEAIAQHNGDGTGEMFGPETDKWGPFNPEYFIRHDGTTLEQGMESAAKNQMFMPAPPVDSANFKRWFGDSKVVDEQGKPKVVLHGTSYSFDAFQKKYAGRSTGASDTSLGFYFTDSPESANFFANWSATTRAAGNTLEQEGANVVPVYLSIEKPKLLLIPGSEKVSEADTEAWRGIFMNQWTKREQLNYKKNLISQGYDGIEFRSDVGITDADPLDAKVSAYLVFKPTQIKSAIANVGTFDPNNPNLSFMPSMNPEAIKGPAIKRLSDGKIFPAINVRTHWQIPDEYPELQDYLGLGYKNYEDGFIDGNGKFFNKTDAYNKAISIGQVPVDYKTQYGGEIQSLELNKAKNFMPSINEGMRSKAEDIIKEKMGAKTSTDQLAAMLKNNGVSPAEMEWSGLNDVLADKAYQTQGITKDEALNVIARGFPKVETLELGASKKKLLTDKARDLFEQLKENPGDYPELKKMVAFSFPPMRIDDKITEARKLSDIYRSHNDTERARLASQLAQAQEAVAKFGEGAATRYGEYILPGGHNYREILFNWNPKEGYYRAPHFGEQGRNLVAHLRVTDRKTSEGTPMLFIEEAQSDWGQDLRGRANPVIDTTATTPDMPFKGNLWKKFLLKQAIKTAVNEGKESIGWTTGAQQADRYDLSKHIDNLRWAKDKDGKYILDAQDHTGDTVLFQRHIPEQNLEKFVGKDIAQKIIDGAGNLGAQDKLVQDILGGVKGGVLRGLDLQVGGEGMKGFYDKELVNIANDIGKKYGAKVRDAQIQTQTDPTEPSIISLIHELPITPEMRDSVKNKGQYMFMPESKEKYGAIKENGKIKILPAEEVFKAYVKDKVKEYEKATGEHVFTPSEVVIDHAFVLAENAINDFLRKVGAGEVPTKPKLPPEDTAKPKRGQFMPITEDMYPKGKAPSKDLLWKYNSLPKRIGAPGLWDQAVLSGHNQELAKSLGVPEDKRFYEQKPDAQKAITDHFVGTGKAQFMPEVKTIPRNDQELSRVLKEPQKSKVGLHRDLPDGAPVGIRIDIPAFNRYGKYVQTIHEPRGNSVGPVIGYDSMVKLHGPVEFQSNETGAKMIHEGSKKFPVATVRGGYNPSRNIPDLSSYADVGYNPKIHSYFYEKSTGKPVIGGGDTVMLGNSAFVKDPQYGNAKDFKFMPGRIGHISEDGSVDSFQAYEDYPASHKELSMKGHPWRYYPDKNKVYWWGKPTDQEKQAVTDHLAKYGAENPKHSNLFFDLPNQYSMFMRGKPAYMPQIGTIEQAKKLLPRDLFGNIDVKASSEDQFFGKDWPKLLKRTGMLEPTTNKGIASAADKAVKDVYDFLQKNPAFSDYYTADMLKTRGVIGAKLGKPLSDEEFRFFQAMNPLLSQRTPLVSNTRESIEALKLFRRDGNLDAIKAKSGELIHSPFSIAGYKGDKAYRIKVFDRIRKEQGGVGKAIDYLMSTVTMKELNALNKEMGYAGNVSQPNSIRQVVKHATGQDEQIPRAFIFGNKLGAYFMNHMGDSRYNTVDVWESRFIKSYFKNLLEKNTGIAKDADEHRLYSKFITEFNKRWREEIDPSAEGSSLQAGRWFYIMLSAKEAGYKHVLSQEPISHYAERYFKENPTK